MARIHDISMKMFKYFAGGLALAATIAVAPARERQPDTAKVIVQAGQAGCRVDLDADSAGTTDAAGNLTIANVDPGDHYVHVECPGKPEAAFFISPKANGEARIGPTRDEPSSSGAAINPTTVAENKTKLTRLVQQAVQLRQQAQLDEAVAALREAMALDPENSDLHREMGITFSLAKEWKRARVEMIEAIRHDRTDADAHNGLGYALEKLGDINGAVKEYRIATNLEPDDPSYRTHYFDALVKIQAAKEVKK
jgi:tetratricopeptide (TPR) repeat protein